MFFTTLQESLNLHKDSMPGLMDKDCSATFKFLPLRCLLSPGNSQNRIVLIFSQSWSSHGLDVSASNDLRRAAVKLTIKVCCFRT